MWVLPGVDGGWRRALEYFKCGLALRRQPGTQHALVFLKLLLALTGEDEAVLDDRLGVVGRHNIYGGLSTSRR